MLSFTFSHLLPSTLPYSNFWDPARHCIGWIMGTVPNAVDTGATVGVQYAIGSDAGMCASHHAKSHQLTAYFIHALCVKA
jgi:hypothetical protein